MSTSERVAAEIAKCREDGFHPDPHGVAEVLVSQDVSCGDYEGCSSELESWFMEFGAEADRQLRGER